MRMDMQLRLQSLRCVQGDEDADEPFAWVFYLTLDGSTITQSKANPDRLVSTVVVKGNEGSHGNLGVDEVVAGRVFAIPASIGAYATSMRSIRISNPLEIVVPGRVVAFFVLLDEDVTSDADIEVAHEKVSQRVQDRFNEFLQNMSLNQIVIDAGQLMIGRPDLDLAGAATEIVQQRFDVFTDQLSDELEDYATDVVIEESNVIQLIENFFDHDDFMGSFKFVPDERAMLGSNLSMSFRDQVRKRNDLSHVYDIHVDVSAQLVPGSEEIARTGSVLSDVIADRGEFVTSGQLLCIGNGTRVPWTRHDLKEQWDFAFNYPFAEAVWSIDGMDLPPGRDDGTLDFAKTVRRARTDVPLSGTKLVIGTEQRTVRVQHSRKRVNGVEHLVVSNRSEDAQYAVTIGLSVVLPNGTRIAVNPSDATFDGQSVRLDTTFLNEYDKCLSTFERRGHKSTHTTPQDLWGPYGRQVILDRAEQQLAVAAQIRGLSANRTAAISRALVKQVGIATAPLIADRRGSAG